MAKTVFEERPKMHFTINVSGKLTDEKRVTQCSWATAKLTPNVRAFSVFREADESSVDEDGVLIKFRLKGMGVSLYYMRLVLAKVGSLIGIENINSIVEHRQITCTGIDPNASAANYEFGQKGFLRVANSLHPREEILRSDFPLLVKALILLESSQMPDPITHPYKKDEWLDRECRLLQTPRVHSSFSLY